MVKPNLKFWVQVITSMCGRDQERYNSEYLQPFVKYCGGSIMFWSGISVSGVGELIKIYGIVNKISYQQILIHHAVWYGKHLLLLIEVIWDHPSIRFLLVIQSRVKGVGGSPSCQRARGGTPWTCHQFFSGLVCDHLDWKCYKRHLTSKEELWMYFMKPENYYWRLFKEITRKLAIVQTVLMSKGDHN